MIVYVDLEHERLRRNEAAWEKSRASRRKHQSRFEGLTGDECRLVPYTQVSPACLRELGPVRAVIVSGCTTDFEHYAAQDLAGLRDVYRAAAWPLLGLCAGYQLMAQSYGAPLGPMGLLPPGAPESNLGEGAVPGMRQERGFMPVRVTAPHPLCAGLGEHPVLYQSHYWEVQSPPAGFEVFAASDQCAIQAMAHPSAPLFGTQFHPEEYDDEHPAGRRVLQNFFRLAGVTV